SFSMTVHGTIAFPRGRAALVPAISADVAMRQSRSVTALETTGAELHHYYQTGHWVPHVSVATRTRNSQISSVVRMISDTLPLTIRVDRAALVDSATGQTWPLPHILSSTASSARSGSHHHSNGWQSDDGRNFHRFMTVRVQAPSRSVPTSGRQGLPRRHRPSRPAGPRRCRCNPRSCPEADLLHYPLVVLPQDAD